jgi:hypothetical protein
LVSERDKDTWGLGEICFSTYAGIGQIFGVILANICFGIYGTVLANIPTADGAWDALERACFSNKYTVLLCLVLGLKKKVLSSRNERNLLLTFDGEPSCSVLHVLESHVDISKLNLPESTFF